MLTIEKLHAITRALVVEFTDPNTVIEGTGFGPASLLRSKTNRTVIL